jgi:hypothetical protein
MFMAVSAAAATPAHVGGASGGGIIVYLATSPDYCDYVTRAFAGDAGVTALAPPGQQVISLQVASANPTVAPGTYSFGTVSTTAISGYYAAYGADGGMAAIEYPNAGTFTIASVTSSGVAGSFDVLFAGNVAGGGLTGAGTHLAGSFNAPICAGLMQALSPDGG